MSGDRRARPVPRAAASRHAVGRRGGRLARLRALARVARRDVRRSPGRTVLVVGLTLLPAAVATLLTLGAVASVRPATSDDVVPAGVEAVLQWYATPVVQDGPLAGLVEPADDGTEHGDTRVATGLDALARTVPREQLVALAGCEDLDHSDGSLRSLRACVLADDPGGRVSVVDGRLPVAAGEVAVAEPDHELGDTLEVREMLTTGTGYVDIVLTVVGVLDPELLGDLALVAPVEEDALSEADDAADGGGPTVVVGHRTEGTYLVIGHELGWDRIVELNAAGFAGTSRRAVADAPTDAQIPYRAQGRGVGDAPRGDASGTVLLVAVGVGLLVVLTIAPAHVIGVRRRARELALLSVTGAAPRDVRHVVMLGATLQGVVAGVVGVLAGVATHLVGEAVAPGWNGGVTAADIRYALPYLALLALVVVLTVALAAWGPGRTAGRLDPVAVLAGRRAEAAPPARLQVLGTLLAAVGLGALVWGARAGSTGVLAAGVLGLVVGTVVVVPSIVRILGRLSRRAPLPTRLALRDSARHSRRTAAAVTAVLATSAALVVGIVTGTSLDARALAGRVHAAGDGRVVVDLGAAGPVRTPLAPGNDTADDIEQLLATVRAHDPAARTTVVHGIGGALDAPAAGAVREVAHVYTATVPAKDCPVRPGEPGAVTDDATRRAQREDPRCDPRAAARAAGAAWNGGLVDDGTVLAALGLPGVEDAVAALAAGRVVDSRDAAVATDGTVTLLAVAPDGAERDPVTAAATYAPALAAAGHLTIVPPDVLVSLGLASEPRGLVVEPSTDDARVAVARALRAQTGSMLVGVEDWTTTDYAPYVRGLVAAGLVLGVGTALLVLLLLAGEARADLAILGAVGAPPRVRKRLAAAQAASVVGTGAVLGTLTGLAIAAAAILVRVTEAGGYDLSFVVVVPWDRLVLLVVGLVAGAWATGWCTVRPRMPLPSEVR